MSADQKADVKRRSSRAAREGGRRRRRSANPVAAATTSVPSVEEATTAAATRDAEQPVSTERTRGEVRRQVKAESGKSRSRGRGIISSERTEGIRKYYRETRAEINKVVWPDRETTINLTLLVIALSVVLGLLLGGIDFILYELFEAF